MTLHVVLGEGSINKRELEHQLNDLWEKAEGEDDDFWFVVQGKAQPTQADKDLVEFFTTHQLHYQTVVPEGVTPADIYGGAAAVHETEGDFTESVVELLMTLPEGDEGADVLALFVNVADDVDEDAELIAQVQAAMEAGFSVFGLNDAMEQVKIEDEAAPPPAAAPEPEPAPEQSKPVPAKKASKKAAAAAAAPATEPERYTRVELDGMTPAEVKALASGMGIKMKSKKEQVEAILAAQSGVPVGNPDVNEQFALVDGAAPVDKPVDQNPVPLSGVVSASTSNPAMTTTTSTSGYIYTNAPVVPLRGDALAEMALIVVHWGDSTITVKHLPAGLVEAFLAQ